MSSDAGQTMPVTVLVAGIYAGANFKRLPWARAGQTIEVAAGWYVEYLLDQGWVRLPDPPAVETSVSVDVAGELLSPTVTPPAGLPPVQSAPLDSEIAADMFRPRGRRRERHVP